MHRRRCIRIIVSMLWLGMAGLMLPQPARAAALFVNAASGTVNPADPCPRPANGAVYRSIQKAVNCAATGDTISVAPGTYAEHVSIPKALTLLGANAGVDARTPAARGPESIIDAGLAGAGLIVGAPNIVIDGFLVQHGRSGLNAGVHIGGADHVQILNCVIVDNAIGLFVNGGPATIRHNRFESNNRTGTAAGGTGLYSDSSNGLHVTENSILGQTVNVGVNFAAPGPNAHANLRFTANSVTGNRIGVNMMGAVAGSLARNTFRSNTNAIVFNGAANGTSVAGNDLAANGTGIRLADPYGIGPNSALALQFNRLVDNTSAITIAAPQAGSYSGTLNAERNWWGCNYGPGASGSRCAQAANGVRGPIDADPWLVLTLAATPAAIGLRGETAQIGASLRRDSAGADTAASGFAPDGIQAQFTATLGTLSAPAGATASGVATVVYTSGPALGTADLTATVDHQSTTAVLTIRLRKLHMPLMVAGR